MNINKKVTLQRIQTLTELHGAPGFEEEVKNYMTQQMAPYVDEFIENRMGGFFGVKKSKNPNAKRVMIAAHMDEIGFMITNITKNGMIQFTNLGGVANDIWQGQRLVIKNRNGDKIIGVVSNIPKHFRTGSEGAPEIKDLTLDIGAQNEDEVRERGIDIGDTIVPHTPFTQLSEHRYSAKAWDNRYGCVLAIEILELLKDIELDELIEAKDVIYYIEGMTNLFIAEGDYKNRAKARIRYIADRMGDEEFVSQFKLYTKAEKEKGGLELNLHLTEIKKEGIKTEIKDKRLIEQKQEGLYTVYLHPVGGQLKLEDLKEILDTIGNFEDVEVRLAMTEGVYFRNLNGKEAEILLDITKKMGGEAEIYHSVACIGVPTCQIGIGNSQGLLFDIMDYFKEKDYSSDLMPRVHISGCTNSCGVHEIGKIGFTGKKKRVDDAVKDVFGLFINGDFTVENVRLGEFKGDMLPERIPEFLYELAMKLEEGNIKFEDYIKEDEFMNLVNKYSV